MVSMICHHRTEIAYILNIHIIHKATREVTHKSICKIINIENDYCFL